MNISNSTRTDHEQVPVYSTSEVDFFSWMSMNKHFECPCVMRINRIVNFLNAWCLSLCPFNIIFVNNSIRIQVAVQLITFSNTHVLVSFPNVI